MSRPHSVTEEEDGRVNDQDLQVRVSGLLDIIYRDRCT